ARVRFHPAGEVSVQVGPAGEGQGPATSYAQIAADALGLRPDDIDIAEADTAAVEFGQGTFNSRSMPVGGSAVYEASRKVLAKARQFAAHTLGAAAVADVGYEAGVFTGPEREDGGPASSVTWQDLAPPPHFLPPLP